jgi:hypothetical protein
MDSLVLRFEVTLTQGVAEPTGRPLISLSGFLVIDYVKIFHQVEHKHVNRWRCHVDATDCKKL